MGRKLASPDHRVAEIAAQQHGVVSLGQLREAGLSERQVLRREGQGHLHRIHRGVYAIGHRGLSAEGRWMAAVLGVAGSHAPGEHAAFLSHLSAAHLWRMLPTGEGSVHVSLRGDSGRAKRDGIRVHRTSTLTPGEITRHLGIPVTTPSRTIADLRSGRRHDRISASRLRTALRQAGVLGLQIDAIDRDPTRSELERTFLHVCRACRLPAPEVNVEVDGMEVDFLWRSRCLVVETDGYRFHRGRAAFEEDRRRDLRLRASGMQVVRIGYEQLMREPQQAADVIQTILTGGH